MSTLRLSQVLCFALSLVALECVAASVATLQPISGDRQIIVTTSYASLPSHPYLVRALDANGMPVAGASLFIGPADDPGEAFMQDEFHFLGFNIGTAPGSENSYTAFGFVPAEYVATTDANGVAEASGHYARFAPSAFPIGARPSSYYGSAPARFWSVVLVQTPPPGHPSVVVEYFDSQVGHYFNTIDQAEIDALEAGKFAGWKRSTGAFIAYASADDAPPEAVPVCRFFSAAYTSHFYTADPAECDTVVARWPDVWTLETRAAFYIFVPDKITGVCAPGLQPIYRMYNNQPIPNHRYVADKALRDRMTGAGWRAEGYGPDAVMMCAAS